LSTTTTEGEGGGMNKTPRERGPPEVHSNTKKGFATGKEEKGGTNGSGTDSGSYSKLATGRQLSLKKAQRGRAGTVQRKSA